MHIIIFHIPWKTPPIVMAPTTHNNKQNQMVQAIKAINEITKTTNNHQTNQSKSLDVVHVSNCMAWCGWLHCHMLSFFAWQQKHLFQKFMFFKKHALHAKTELGIYLNKGSSKSCLLIRRKGEIYKDKQQEWELIQTTSTSEEQQVLHSFHRETATRLHIKGQKRYSSKNFGWFWEAF